MQLCVEAVCDELEYEGSPIYDEYPDRIFLEKLTKRALEKWQKFIRLERKGRIH